MPACANAWTRTADDRTPARGVAIDDLAAATSAKLDDAVRYRAAYNRYVAPFAGILSDRLAKLTRAELDKRYQEFVGMVRV